MMASHQTQIDVKLAVQKLTRFLQLSCDGRKEARGSTPGARYPHTRPRHHMHWLPVAQVHFQFRCKGIQLSQLDRFQASAIICGGPGT
jgi:hypothetical protein